MATDIRTTPSAVFQADDARKTKTDTGTPVPIAQCDEKVCAAWGNDIDQKLEQINEAFVDGTPIRRLQVAGQMWSATVEHAPAGTAQTLDWNEGNSHAVLLDDATGDVTLTFTNSADGACLELLIYRDVAIENDVVWPAGIRWPNGVVPSTIGAAVGDLRYGWFRFFAVDGQGIFGFSCLTGIAFHIGDDVIVTENLNDGCVTNVKLDAMPARSVKGRSAGSTGAAADIAAVNGSAAVLRESGGSIDFGTVATAGIADDAISNAKLRNSGALSVIGRSANSTGDPADISATAATGAVLRESGSTIGWGTIATAGIADDAVTDAKLRNSGALSVVGRSANSTGDPADISASAASGAVLRESGSTIGWGTVATAGIADEAVTDAKLRNGGACSVIGRSANSTGDTADISASGNGVFLRRESNVLGFGNDITADVTVHGDVHQDRIYADDDTALTTTDYAISAGWGGTATKGITSGSRDTRGTLTVTANGSGLGTNPTITITFKDGAYAAAPFAIVVQSGGTGTKEIPTYTTTSTTLTITRATTPVAGSTYIYSWQVIG